MAILHRRGAKADFNAQKMLGGEMAVTIDGSRKAYVAFAPGDVKELASKEDVQNIVDNFTNSVDKKISEAVEQVTTEAEEQIVAVIQKGEEVLDSIPADYQEIAEGVVKHETEIATLTQSKSDAITVEKSGTTIVATDSSDKGFEQFKTYGKSEQRKTSGKNHIPISEFDTNSSGYTSIYMNPPVVEEGKNYILSGKTTDGIVLSNSNCQILWRDSDNNILASSNDTSWTTGVNYGQIENAVTFEIFTTLTGKKVQIQIEEGTVATPYEPYTGAIPSPNPEYEQPIVSAGQKLALGNQLIDISTVTNALIDHNTGMPNHVESWLTTDFIEVTKKEVTASVNNKSNNFIVRFCEYDSNKVFLKCIMNICGVEGNASRTIPLQDETKYVRLSFGFNNAVCTKESYIASGNVIQLNYGSTALPYEPYTGGVKKAYDVGIRKKLTNNLLDYIDKYKALGATVSSDGREVIFPTNLQTYMEKLEINYGLFNAGTYYLSVEPIDAPCIRTEIELDGNLIGDTMLVSSVKDFAFTVSKAGELSIKLYTSAGAGSGNVIGGFKNLVLSTEPNTEWQPYTEQTLTLNRVLRGIPVTDSSLANYTDENGQMWCADEIDRDKEIYVGNLLENTATSRTVSGVTVTVNDEDGTFAMNGIANALIMLSLQDVCKVNTDGSYILSGCPSDGSENGYRLDVRCDGNTLGIDVGGGITVELNSTKDYSILLRIGIGTVCDNLTFKPMIRPVEIDGIPTSAEYVPYSHGKFTKKRGVLVQRITHYKLTNFVMSYLNAVGTRIFRIAIDALLNTPSSVRQPILCNRVEATTADYQYAFNCNAISIADGAVLMSIKDVTTESTFRNIINSTDYWIAYPLATPIETPLTDAEIAAYKALHSNKPNTIITNDAGCFMEVEYVADTKTHIEQNYVPVSKYTALEDRVSALERLHV